MKKKVLSGFAIAAASLAVLTGCAQVNQGTVVKKYHEDAYYTTTQMCSMYDSKMQCKMWMPQQHYHPESWNVKISSDTPDGTKYGNHEVSQEQYDTIKIGDYMDFGE